MPRLQTWVANASLNFEILQNCSASHLIGKQENSIKLKRPALKQSELMVIYQYVSQFDCRTWAEHN